MPRWLLIPLLIREIRSIKYLFQDKQAPKRYKFVVILGLIYLISPIDLIPAPILGFSIIDDCVIWGCILYYLKEPLEKYADRKQKEKSRADRRAFRGKKIIEDAEYTVVKEEKEERHGKDR